jgi:cytochrome c-type biogenesis protein CcmH/NrfF
MRPALVVLLVGAYGIAPASANQQNAPSIAEQRLLQNLACTCSSCNLEPIERCRCEQAKNMRAEVKEALRGVDTSSVAACDAAYQRVRDLFAAKYGAAVLTPNLKKTDPRMSWLPVIFLVGGALSLVIITRRSLKRRRAS